MGKVTFINAIVQGKLAGGVYARNKAGYYIRQFTKPLNPRTAAQIGARSSFNAASSAWHALTDLQKAAWNSYSLTNFTPKGGVSGSPVSGFNAFVSLYNAANNANRLSRTNVLSAGGALTGTFVDYTAVMDAPVKELSQMIQEDDGTPLPLIFADATLVAATAATTVTFNFPKELNSAPVFQDAVGNIPVGVMLQVSKALTQSQQFVANPHITTINVVRPPDEITGWTHSTSVTMSATTADYDIVAHKLWFTAGDKAQIDAYLVGQNGAMKHLGAKIVEIS